MEIPSREALNKLEELCSAGLDIILIVRRLREQMFFSAEIRDGVYGRRLWACSSYSLGDAFWEAHKRWEQINGSSAGVRKG